MTHTGFHHRGFSLIELLLVISIIAMLAAVVLAALSHARDKGSDTKVKSQMSSLRNNLELYYTTNGDYGLPVVGSEASGTTIGTGCNSEIFASTGATDFVSASIYPLTAAGAGKCTSSGLNYAVTVALVNSGTFWCMDSTGTSKQTTVLQADSTYTCP